MNKVSIHIGHSCKLNCHMCFEHREPIEYDFDEYFPRIREFIKKNKPRGVSIYENRKSDPLSDENLPVLIKWLAERSHIKKINITTSGLYEIPVELKVIDKIHWGISIDGPKEFHDKNRGKGSFEKSLAAVKDLLAVGRIVFVRIIATKDLFQYQRKEVRAFCLRLKKMGAKVFVQRYTSKQHKDITQYIDFKAIEGTLQKWIFTAKNFIKQKGVCLDPSGLFKCPPSPILTGTGNDVSDILTGPCFSCANGYSYPSTSGSESSSSSSSGRTSGSGDGCLLVIFVILLWLLFFYKGN